jgi:hypothetical protein
VLNAVSSSFALTASSADNLLVRNTLTAQTLVVQTITSSVDFVTGSTRFGSISANTHVFTGSMFVTGAFYVTTGSVGIGTTSPSKLLHLYNTAATDVILVESTQVFSTLAFKSSTNSSTVTIGIDGAGNAAFENKLTTGAMAFVTSGSEKLRITAAGYVGIGTSSPLSKFAVKLSGATSPLTVANTTGFDNTYVTFGNDTASGKQLGIGVSQTDQNGSYLISVAPASEWIDLSLYARNNIFYGNGTERMRITGGGNVGIGVIPSAWASGATALQIGTAATLWNRASDNLLILAANSYFNGSTDIQITTGTSNRMYFVSGGTFFERAASTAAGSSTPWTSSMVISANGNIGAPASGTNIFNASDKRLKQNITTITDGLNKIIALNPVKFNWIDGFEPTEDGKDMLGFIAQDVQEVIPEAVESFSNSLVTVGELVIDNTLRVNEKFIIPVLVKAMQELKAEFDAYKTTHP